MRISIVSMVAVLASCSTVRNPNVCCITDEQCAEVGFDSPAPCGMGQACGADHTCVAAQCSTNADCDEASPVCRLGFCESTCSADPDCAEVEGRTHCLNSVCVGCTDSNQCGQDTAICDMEEHTCRGCEVDSECASGVCIEIDGVCAEEARVLYAVGSSGATSGECGRATPCKLDYALTKARANRDVVHIGSGTASLPATFSVSIGLIIDGAPTQLTSANPSTFTIEPSASLTLESVILENGFRSTSNGGVTRVFDVQGDRSQFTATGGTLLIEDSRLEGDATNVYVTCGANATFLFRRNEVVGSRVDADACVANIERNRFSTSGTSSILHVMGGKAIVENNVFVASDSGADLVFMIGGIGSAFRFNTVANTNPSIYTAAALYCDAAIAITNNIFAYNSTNPIQGTGACTITSSLFDTQGTSDAGANAVGDRATFFANLAQGDFHLASGSPARDAGQSGLVQVDIEGTPRDNHPDIGAYEAH